MRMCGGGNEAPGGRNVIDRLDSVASDLSSLGLGISPSAKLDQSRLYIGLRGNLRALPSRTLRPSKLANTESP